MSLQSFSIFPKIIEFDNLLQRQPELRERVREVHPEISFWAWRGGVPISESKKKGEGRRVRLALAEEWLGTGVLSHARGDRLKENVADDDILDAIAALWTATRLAFGKAETLPQVPPFDAKGLRMEMVY